MQGQDPRLRAALKLLGLAEGADRDAVIRAYRRLAKATHPDVSDAPDAQARFTALDAAYRLALGGAEEPVSRPVPQPASSPTVRITVHPSREEPTRRPGAATGYVGRVGPLVGDRTLVAPPIVAGPVRVVPPSRPRPS